MTLGRISFTSTASIDGHIAGRTAAGCPLISNLCLRSQCSHLGFCFCASTIFPAT